MTRKIKGRLAEAKVIAYLIENEYEVYLPFSGNSKYDVLAFKDEKIYRISIKFTSVQRNSGSWAIELRQISRRNKAINIDKFDHTQYDLIAVYIGPKNKVILVDAEKAKTRSLHIRE